jgi:hypothetical protein
VPLSCVCVWRACRAAETGPEARRTFESKASEYLGRAEALQRFLRMRGVVVSGAASAPSLPSAPARAPAAAAAPTVAVAGAAAPATATVAGASVVAGTSVAAAAVALNQDYNITGRVAEAAAASAR